MGRAVEFYEYMHERCRELRYDGLPVQPPRTLPGEGCDGPLDAAYKLRGAAEVCLDMLTDPDYCRRVASSPFIISERKESSMSGLEGKVALVTGSGRGLGRTYALRSIPPGN